ncbi:MAG: MBOAT family protein, partial [Spirochaetia bacterium]|nr:MBOAT family protein [Spirochaetia bacterium]
MVFTSFHFLAFFFVTITLGHLLKNRVQKLFLLAASYYFYGAFEPWYLLILWGSSSWDYVSALG